MHQATTLEPGFYRGTLTHARLSPVVHNFSYPIDFIVGDLPGLIAFSPLWPLFGYNRPSPVALHDDDHLVPVAEGLDILARLNGVLRAHSELAPVTVGAIVTLPRYFGFGFKPVSFYFASSDAGHRPVLMEVNNTYSERHVYVFGGAAACHTDGGWTFEKTFFVSPFNNTRGNYEVDFRFGGGQFAARVNLLRDGQPILMTALSGRRLPMRRMALIGSALRSTVTGNNAHILIAFEALRLRAKGMKPLMKPDPTSEATLIGRRRKF